jgi:putative DNA modification/repair radical SAM protein
VDTLAKLDILAEAARYDVACTSSGVSRPAKAGMVGNASPAGCCHSFTPDGRCVTLLKVLMSNVCSYDCAYCVNRRQATCARATFAPRELAELTVDFYKRNYIEGLFLSSGVLGTPDATTERMIECLRVLREELLFNGYVHAKVIPGTSPELVDSLGRLADRLSVNLELPSASSLSRLCPEKQRQQVLGPMGQIRHTRDQEETALLASGKRTRRRALPTHEQEGLALGAGANRLTLRPRSQVSARRRSFAPAGQSTQLIIGATPETDNHILQLSQSLYQHFDLKRVFFSAYMPMVADAGLPARETPVPLRREHRLYQADWLMRYYAFTPDELATPEEPWLDLDVDPKLAWALRHIDRFPVEVMDASLTDLLRVPGIGPVGARRILAARRSGPLSFEDLRALKVTLKRACHFLTVAGKRDESCPLNAGLIRERVMADARQSAYNRTRRMAEGQLSLF